MPLRWCTFLHFSSSC